MDIPRSIEDITPAWLNEALRIGGFLGGSQVSSINNRSAIEGGLVSNVQRLEVSYDGPDETSPESIIVKLSLDSGEMRDFAVDTGLYEREANFYQQIGSKAGISIPVLYYGDSDPESGQHVLLLEDLGHLRAAPQEQGANFIDTKTVLNALATMHARWWNSPRLNKYSWLVNPGDPAYAKRWSDSFAGGVEPAFRRLHEYAPDGLKEIAVQFASRVPEVLRESGRNPVTLNHGDFRLANLFFNDTTEATTVFAVDWQLVQPSKAAGDVARFMFSSVSPEHRSDYETELLGEYHRALQSHGINEYSFDEFIHDYRAAHLRNMMIVLSVIPRMTNEFIESDSGQLTLLLLGKRLQAIVDWDCGRSIPN